MVLAEQKLVLPKEAKDELKKKKSKKLKATVTVGIDNEGTVKKIEITEPPLTVSRVSN